MAQSYNNKHNYAEILIAHMHSLTWSQLLHKKFLSFGVKGQAYREVVYKT